MIYSVTLWNLFILKKTKRCEQHRLSAHFQFTYTQNKHSTSCNWATCITPCPT